MPRLTMQLRVRRRDLLADSLGRQPLCRHPQFSISPKGHLDVDCRCPVSPIRSSTAPAPLASRTRVAPVPRPSGSSAISVARSGSSGGSPSRWLRSTPVPSPGASGKWALLAQVFAHRVFHQSGRGDPQICTCLWTKSVDAALLLSPRSRRVALGRVGVNAALVGAFGKA